MEIYFLKSAACLAILLLFYKLLLEKENMHIIKRVYLLLAVVASIVIPLITFTTYVEPIPGNIQPVFLTSSEEIKAEPIAFTEYLPFIFWFVYITGVIFFSLKFIRNLKDLVDRIRRNPQIKRNRFTNVLLSEKVSPHTFFSYIFLNKSKYEKEEIPQEVLVHEEAHALQKHSLDILVVELFQIIFWLNPFILLLKKAVKLNHEFLADRAVILQGISTPEYQQTLLSFSSGELQSDLVNPINYSSIKKRFTVMKTHTTKKAIWIRSLLFLPLFVALIYSCSSTEELERPIEEKALEENSLKIASPEMISQYNRIARKYNSQENPRVEVDDYEKMRKIYDLMSPEQRKTAENLPIIEIIEVVEDNDNTIEVLDNNNEIIEVIEVMEDAERRIATPEMIAEYNKLARYYNSNVSQEGTPIKKKDYQKMKYIYSIMAPEQKKKSEAFPVPAPPPPPNEKMVSEYNKLAIYYNEKEITEKVVQEKDFQRMLYIYGLMSESQRKKAEKLPPPPPPAPVEEALPAPPPPAPEVSDAYPPPPPPPPSYEDLVERGATFYYNGKVIEAEAARRLVEVEKKVNVQITDVDGKPVVRLTEKEKK